MTEVLIIGCGVVGAAAMYALSRYDIDVVCVEKENDVATGTTKANSAIIHAGYDPTPGTLMAKLNSKGSVMAKEICKKLSVPYKQTGSLVLAFNEEDEKMLKELCSNASKNGVRAEIINGDEVRKKEPCLSSEVKSALFAPDAAIVSPWEYALAMAQTAIKNGAELYLNTEVLNITKTEAGFIVCTNNGDFTAKYVINASGVNADEIHEMVHAKTFTTLPSRGEYYLLDKSEGAVVNSVIFQCPNKNGKGVLVAPTVHGNLIVGPNASDSSRGGTENTAMGLEFIAEMAKKSVPNINLRASIRNFAGVRANTNCDDFVIEMNDDGFMDLAGIKSPGLSAAPAIAEYAVELLQKSGLRLSKKSSFIDEREHICFAELSESERGLLIKKNAAYGKIVCRCETVTMGEILDCFNSLIPPVSLDGVKRRVRAGMGRCQGGFCGPRVLEMLSEQLHMHDTEILQDTQGTYILTGKTKENADDDV